MLDLCIYVFVDVDVNHVEPRHILSTTSDITSGSSVDAADNCLLMENQSTGNYAMAIRFVQYSQQHSQLIK